MSVLTAPHASQYLDVKRQKFSFVFHLSGGVMYHITVLICIFLMTNQVGHFFVYLMAIRISFSMKSLFKYFCL